MPHPPATAVRCLCGHDERTHNLRVRNVANCSACLCGGFRGLADCPHEWRYLEAWERGQCVRCYVWGEAITEQEQDDDA